MMMMMIRRRRRLEKMQHDDVPTSKIYSLLSLSIFALTRRRRRAEFFGVFVRVGDETG